MHLKGRGFEGADRIHLVQDKDRRRTLVKTPINLWVLVGIYCQVGLLSASQEGPCFTKSQVSVSVQLLPTAEN
jgi:hypothetical protein